VNIEQGEPEAQSSKLKAQSSKFKAQSSKPKAGSFNKAIPLPGGVRGGSIS